MPGSLFILWMFLELFGIFLYSLWVSSAPSSLKGWSYSGSSIGKLCRLNASPGFLFKVPGLPL